jgi:hypothetical protein
MAIVTRPSLVVIPVMPSGEPPGLKGLRMAGPRWF